MMRSLFAFILALVGSVAFAQPARVPAMDYSHPEEYEIAGITVSGTRTVDPSAVKLFAGLQVGDKIEIPGERISRSIRNLWDQKLFSDVKIEAVEFRGRAVFLHIVVMEKPRLARFKVNGVTKGENDKLYDKMGLGRGQQVNDANISRAEHYIKDYFVDKGYLSVRVTHRQVEDTVKSSVWLENSVVLFFDVERGPRVKIKDVVFNGNEELSDKKLRHALKKTKRKRWWNIFGSSKFLQTEYEADKARVRDAYNNEGFRNATIVRDTMFYVSPSRIRVEMDIEEGTRFHFRNVSVTGNTKHTTAELMEILAIKKGDVYSKRTLDSRLYMNPSGRDISSLYMDDGYLAFSPDPVELVVEGDSIDLEVRLREGKQYRIRNVTIKGNTKTNEHVIRREIRTKPGQLFNRSDVVRTQRELSQLGYFNPESLGVNPIQDPRTGTVDLEYTVEEKPSDKLELSGGWGAGRLVMSVGLSFTNFSFRNAGKLKNYTPLPSGDGQTFNIRAQTNGKYFQSYSLSFVEPWLGGRKANSFSVSAYHSVQTNGQPKYVDTVDGR